MLERDAGPPAMFLHLIRVLVATGLLTLMIVYPFLPGDYDAMALPLSGLVQAAAVLALVFVAPIGALWLASELWPAWRYSEDKSYGFALASMIALLFVAVLLAFAGLMSVGLSLPLVVIAILIYPLARMLAKVRHLRSGGGRGIDPLPIYLLILPIGVVVLQLALSGPLTEFSRARAIANSGPMIAAIEEYNARHGRYPVSAEAVHKDYSASVVGVEKYRYTLRGDAYNLFFEQPRFLLDQIGTREFVVFNKLDENTMISHTMDVLELTPAEFEIEARRGHNAVKDRPELHWKCFLFD